MFRKLLKGVLLTAAIGLAGVAWAAIPPPPVNQNLGIPDGTFTSMTAETCLGCHGDPANAPAPVKPGHLPDRHHVNRVGTPIDPNYSAAPFPNPEGIFNCLTCHAVDRIDDPNAPGGVRLEFDYVNADQDPNFRNCLRCHAQPEREDGTPIATVHHLTDKAQNKLCHQCHGSLINDPTGDHRIPDGNNAPDPDKARHCGKALPDGDRNFYDITMITPWPGDKYDSREWVKTINTFYADCLDFAKRYYDPEVLGGQYNIDPPRYRYEADAAGIIQAIEVPDGEMGGRTTGNCEHCHYSGDNPGDAVQPNTGLAMIGEDGVFGVPRNVENHHATGVGQPGSGSVHTCDLCHTPTTNEYTIRGCEACHGISTLHAIEFDAAGDGIIIGEEEPFMGHIGNYLNCNGCHLNWKPAQAAQASVSLMGGDPKFGAPAPSISEISTVATIAGTATEISIKGVSLEGPSTRLELVGTDGKVIEVPMEENDYTTARAVLPADVPADTYDLYVTRGMNEQAVRSPVINFLVAPNVNIDSVSCNGGTVTVTGSGFGSEQIVGLDDKGLFGDDNSCSVKSWSDTEIVAECGSGVGSVTVSGLFGEASSDAACGGVDDAGRPKWWSIWSWWSSWSWSRR